jgi:hypothetical protein
MPTLWWRTFKSYGGHSVVLIIKNSFHLPLDTIYTYVKLQLSGMNWLFTLNSSHKTQGQESTNRLYLMANKMNSLWWRMLHVSSSWHIAWHPLRWLLWPVQHYGIPQRYSACQVSLTTNKYSCLIFFYFNLPRFCWTTVTFFVIHTVFTLFLGHEWQDSFTAWRRFITFLRTVFLEQ